MKTKTLVLSYNSNHIEIRNGGDIVLKPRHTYAWYKYDEATEDVHKLKKFFKLRVIWSRTVDQEFHMTNGIHVNIDGDDDVRSSPSLDLSDINSTEDLREILAEALLRVQRFDVGPIPTSLQTSRIAEGCRYLAVSIADPEAVASLFSDEYLNGILEWVKKEIERK